MGMTVEEKEYVRSQTAQGTSEADIIRTLMSTRYPDKSFCAVKSMVQRFKKKIGYYEQRKNDNGLYQCSLNEVLPTTCNVDTNANSSVEYTANGNTTFTKIIELQEGEQITKEMMLRAHNLNPREWEVVTYKNNYWQSQRKGGSTVVLYQSKLTARPKKDEDISPEEIAEHFIMLSKNYAPKSFPTPLSKTKGYLSKDRHYLYEVNIADLHLGKLCWDGETGNNFDCDIAKQRFFKVIASEVERIKLYKPEEILFVWTNDFFNSDGISNATTGGTPQDVDSRWNKLFRTGCEILVEAITEMSRYAPVKTFYVASNHSRMVDFYAINYLYAWFNNNNNVYVDLDSRPRYYYKYGNNLIGFAHSYYEKKNNLPYLMQIERKEDWGKTTYREFHLAHYHSEKVEEKGGIIFRWLPSITGDDAWHTDCGYIGAVKRSYSFVYDKENGLISMNCTTV